MKAQAEPVDLIGIVAVVVVIILIAGVFERDTIFEALRQIATYTGPAVARDISGLITIAAAAPGDITMNYYQNTKYAYVVEVKDRSVSVTITQGTNQAVHGEADSLVSFKKTLQECSSWSISKIGGKYDISCLPLKSS